MQWYLVTFRCTVCVKDKLTGQRNGITSYQLTIALHWCRSGDCAFHDSVFVPRGGFLKIIQNGIQTYAGMKTGSSADVGIWKPVFMPP